VLAVGGLALAVWFFTANDDATTGAPATALAPGVAAAQDPRAFAGELARGNLVLSIDDTAGFPAARRLARTVTGGTEDSAALLAAGQSIRVVAPEGGQGGQGGKIIAYAHGRTITAPSLDDPGLRAFLEYWLGRAAG
jgi:hypothetical protein